MWRILAVLVMGAACSSSQHAHVGMEPHEDISPAAPMLSGWEGGVRPPERMQDGIEEVDPVEPLYCTVYFESDDIFEWPGEIEACERARGPGHPNCVRMSSCYHVDMWSPSIPAE